jgi:hypothetical protein
MYSSVQEGRVNFIATATDSTSTLNYSSTGNLSLTINPSKVVYVKFTANSSKIYTFLLRVIMILI